jgi:hypothetical protein
MKTYIVEHGALSLVDGEAKYRGDFVTEKELGDQRDRHVKNGAVREATQAEIRAGKAGAVEDPAELTLEQQVEQEKAAIASAELRIKSLEQQIDERDKKAKAEADAKAKAEADSKKK